VGNETAAPSVKILVGGTEIPPSNFQSYVVDRDMFQPDMASVVLSNQGDIYSGTKCGDSLEVKAGDQTIFKGDVVGVEPVYKGGEKTRILLRGMNRLHRLIRQRKSKTFTEMTDKDILSAVVGEAKLQLDWKHDVAITYKHVYQHNQTDLEFLRTRAARIGAHVWCVDQTVHVWKPDLSSGPIAELKVDESSETGALLSFSPRLSSAGIVKKITVKGWDPEKKELIEGTATCENSKLGKENAATACGELAGEVTYTVDHPIWSREEATAIAKARMMDASLSFITGEAEVKGDPKFDLGKVVKIVANAAQQPGDDPFNGNYYIMGVTHRMANSKSKDSGQYTTILKLARDAQKGG
jgi:phage protein D